jgi:hypothetical protein
MSITDSIVDQNTGSLDELAASAHRLDWNDHHNGSSRNKKKENSMYDQEITASQVKADRLVDRTPLPSKMNCSPGFFGLLSKHKSGLRIPLSFRSDAEGRILYQV